MSCIAETVRDRAMSDKYWTPWVLRTTGTSEDFKLLPILAAILNFAGKGKCRLSR